MKNKIILLLNIFLAVPLFLYPSNAIKKMFSGSIEFPHASTFSDLCLFYKGEKLKIENHGSMPVVEYSFFDSADVHSIYLIITKEVTQSIQTANTIENLKILPNSDYICYKLEAKRDINLDQSSTLSWHIHDHKITNNTIPLNSVIFLFEPKYITGLKVQSWRAENTFRIIPTIVIDPSTTKKQLSQAIIAGQLAAIDINSVHAPNDNYSLPANINNKN